MTDSLSPYLSARASMNEFRDKLIAEYHEHQAAAGEIGKSVEVGFRDENNTQAYGQKAPPEASINYG